MKFNELESPFCADFVDLIKIYEASSLALFRSRLLALAVRPGFVIILFIHSYLLSYFSVSSDRLHFWWWFWSEFSKFPKVLSRSCKKELISCPVGAAQSQSTHL